MKHGSMHPSDLIDHHHFLDIINYDTLIIVHADILALVSISFGGGKYLEGNAAVSVSL